MPSATEHASPADAERADAEHAAKRPRLAAGPAGVAPAGVERAAEAAETLVAEAVRALVAEAGAGVALAAAARDAARLLAAALAALPPADADPAPVAGFLRDLGAALPRPLRFCPPARVELVGEWAAGAGLAEPAACADVALELPAACLDAKDQLNHRWHAKRALYLAHVEAALLASGAAARAGVPLAGWRWACVDGDARRPALVLALAPAGGAPLELRLLPVPPAGAFPPARLAPGRNNLRSAAGAGGAPAPTPHYNDGVARDARALEHAAALRAAAARAPAFPAAAVLLQAWAARAQLGAGADGVPPRLLAMLLAHLTTLGANAGATEMHLFRAALAALAAPKTFAGAGLVMARAVGAAVEAAPVPTAREWRAAGDSAVFVDPSGWLNLAAGVSAGALAAARDAARRALALLAGAPGPEALDAVLLARPSLAALYDAWYRVEVPAEGSAEGSGSGGGGGDLDGDLPRWRAADRRAARLAARALGARAVLVRAVERGAAAPRLRRGAPGAEAPAALLALRLDAAAALSVVDVGPPADDAAAAKAFRAFWGERSELRRFQDGAIAEAVAWPGGPAERHLIVDASLAWALGRHLPPGAAVRGGAGALDGALARRRGSPDGDAAAQHAVEAAAERLSKRLRALDSEALALRVVGVTLLAPALRRAAAFPPALHPLAGAPGAAPPSGGRLPRVLPALELLCTLEGSGRWPDAPEALAKAKAALGVQLADALRAGHGLDAAAAEAHVDVLADGFAFRLLLHTERDGAARARAAEAAGGAPPPPLPPAEDAALRVWHQGLVAAAAAANAAFSPAARLAKRWVAAHWLSPHLVEEAVELIVAAAFAPGGAAPPPASRVAGLLRFLRLLGEHPWAAAPLASDPALRGAAAAAFGAARRGGGAPPAMFLAGPGGACAGWTRARPARPMLHRAAVLARRAAGRLEAALLAGAPAAAALAAAFCHDEGDYDAVIRLRRDALPDADLPRLPGAGAPPPGAFARALAREVPDDRHCRAVLRGVPPAVLAARGDAAVRRELLVGFAPLERYVGALEARLGGAAAFCADFLAGDAVGVKWRAAGGAPGPLRLELAHAVAPVPGRKGAALAVVFDPLAALQDCVALGAGLVEAVELRQG